MQIALRWLAAGALPLLLAACNGTPAPRAAPAPAPAAQRGHELEKTIELPHGDGRVHVIAIRESSFEATRCLVVVSASAPASVACGARSIDEAPPEQ